MTTVRESGLAFECDGSAMVGVLSHADQPSDLGLLLLVGGPQYRVGSHRQYVELARAAARGGVTTLRFDFRGLGDSSGELLDFKEGDQGPDIGAAIDALQRNQPHVRRVALWGLCGGATAALLYIRSHRDPRVAGLALCNPFLQTLPGMARTQVKQYYGRRLLQRQFWQNLASGRVGWSQLSDFAGTVRKALAGAAKTAPETPRSYTDASAEGWAAFQGPILLLMSEHDYTAQAFDELCSTEPAWQAALARRPAQRVDLLGADHTTSTPQAMAELVRSSVEWLQALARHGRSA